MDKIVVMDTHLSQILTQFKEKSEEQIGKLTEESNRLFSIYGTVPPMMEQELEHWKRQKKYAILSLQSIELHNTVTMSRECVDDEQQIRIALGEGTDSQLNPSI